MMPTAGRKRKVGRTLYAHAGEPLVDEERKPGRDSGTDDGIGGKG